MAAVNHLILPELRSGRGTARQRRGVEGPGGGGIPLPHSLREWSPSPSKLGEE